MFKTVAAFDEAVCAVLVTLMDGGEWDKRPESLNKFEFSDVLEHMVSAELVKGVAGQVVKGSGFQITSKYEPRVSRAGLVLIEEFRSKPPCVSTSKSVKPVKEIVKPVKLPKAKALPKEKATPKS